ncbi:MAG: hypothetical protein AYK19_17060 [Theionarchaea archaeon DG-70-1]|nr:MAG: hypothetical protein AYK19_17060 [Theionarchaea archaeon DG-70-1]
MKKCPYCGALNSERASFCWRCYKQLYTMDSDGYLSLRRRIKERMRDILQYRDIRELLREKIKLMVEKEKESEELRRE